MDGHKSSDVEGMPLKNGAFVRCLAFSPDGQTLATGGEDATVLVWDVTPALVAGPGRRSP